ncbi:ArsR/SmtB family transcription factor [Haliangium sp.]|uniref:ArsR/SmtB family transcription factor n=1 Tax=Haliangium sp. TaxID=2663208 RepID=UPI003D13F4C4
MPQPAPHADPHEVVFDALGSPIRRAIVRLLASGPRSVGDIAAEFPVSRPAVSKHLRILEDAALVSYTRQGNRNLFQLEQRGFAHARDWLDGFWDEALARFVLVAENTSPRRGPT